MRVVVNQRLVGDFSRWFGIFGNPEISETCSDVKLLNHRCSWPAVANGHAAGHDWQSVWSRCSGPEPDAFVLPCIETNIETYIRLFQMNRTKLMKHDEIWWNQDSICVYHLEENLDQQKRVQPKLLFRHPKASVHLRDFCEAHENHQKGWLIYCSN